MEGWGRGCTRVHSEHLPHRDRARCNVCAHAGGSEKPAGTSHGRMRAGVHACASERLPAPRSCGRAPAATLLAAGAWEGLARPAWGRGGSGGGSWWGSPRRGKGWRGGWGVPASPLTLVTQTTSEYFHVMHKQVKNSLIQTQRANRKGPGPAHPLPLSPPAGRAAAPRPPAHRTRLPADAAGTAPRAGRGPGRAPPVRGEPRRSRGPGAGAAWGRCLVLSWGTGPRLYQMPLDRPPGGARIRAEARFGTWSSI